MSSLTEFRRQKDVFFKTDPQSPLMPDQRTNFDSLRYFPENPQLRITTKVEESSDQQIVPMITSTGAVKEYYKYGQFSFEVDGQTATLQVYQDADRTYFFLPFVDATAPEETYGAGRYLDLEPEHGNTFVIDFNYAYNPYCAYNENWNCPIPPRENRLAVRIEAGEKTFKKDL
ncbi:MAG TPA: DUF1684 domain-containing protein [Anaerolineae bacterium]|nr:DUF1684 domain-containing protein [Anaerolineae bacterium]